MRVPSNADDEPREDSNLARPPRPHQGRPDEDSSNHKVESFELAVSLDLDSQEFKYLEATRDFNRGEGGLHDAIDRSELGILVIPTCCNVSASFASLEGSPITSIPLEFYRPAEL